MCELSIIIPAYNEEESLKTFLPELIQFCKKENYHLIITNDGSKDNTLEVLKQYQSEECFTICNHKVNKGYGGAIKSGVMAAQTKYIITIDADGQHYLDDVNELFQFVKETDADMIVGNRQAQKDANLYRGIGKSLIRGFAKILLPINIYDINSGMKLYNTELAKKYIKLCPDHMAYSDIIAMVFISQRHLVLEKDIRIKPRLSGESTINTMTALETVKEILNIVVLFNPMRIFLPIAFVSILVALAWGVPIVLKGRGVSTGALLGITTGIIFFFLGLLAEQLALIRKSQL